MIFLIDYDRRRGQIVSLRKFSSSQQTEAADAQLKLELELNNKGIRREIVLLEAASEAALRRTHRRYFENLATLGEPV